MSGTAASAALVYDTPEPGHIATHQAIVEAEQRLEALQDKFLRTCGWARVCDTPGSYWVWTKEWNGRRYTCGTDLALSFQLGMWA